MIAKNLIKLSDLDLKLSLKISLTSHRKRQTSQLRNISKLVTVTSDSIALDMRDLNNA